MKATGLLINTVAQGATDMATPYLLLNQSDNRSVLAPWRLWLEDCYGHRILDDLWCRRDCLVDSAVTVLLPLSPVSGVARLSPPLHRTSDQPLRLQDLDSSLKIVGGQG